MTASVKRRAVMVATWIVVTTSATAMASWAVSFVTPPIADPLGPSDVAAASAHPALQVPTWVYGVEPVSAPATTPSKPPVPADAENPPAPVTVSVNASVRMRAPAAHGAAEPAAKLVARRYPTGGSPRLAVAGVTPPAAAVFAPAHAPPTWSAASAAVHSAAVWAPLAARPRRWPSSVLANYRG